MKKITKLFDLFNELGLTVSEQSKAMENDLTIILNISVKPGSKLNKISKDLQGNLKIHTTKRAVEGEANRAVLKLLSKGLGVAASALTIVSGPNCGHKRIEVQYSFTVNKNEDYYIVKLKKMLA